MPADGDSRLADALDRTVAEADDRGLLYDARSDHIQRRRMAYAEHDVHSVNDRRSVGVCIRVWVDGASGFASSHELTDDALEAMVDQAVGLAKANRDRDNPSYPYASPGQDRFERRARIDEDPFAVDPGRIAARLERCYEGARDRAPEARASASFASMKRRTRYADAHGREGVTEGLVSTLASLVVAKGSDREGSGVAALGGQRDLAELGAGSTPERIGGEAADDALEDLEAVPAPSGRQRVLCDNHVAGVLAHESFGHLIEADVVEMNWSLLAGRQGERFADETVNVVDTPVPPDGVEGGVPVPYDQEGVEGREVRILDDGVLDELMHVRGSAAQRGLEPTGNGRALNARHPPIARMRNTFFEPGDLTKEEALEQLGDGVYLVGNRGGAPASDGTFMFTARKGYRVEDGEIVEPLRSTSVSGHILEFLENVEGLTRDFDLKITNFGGCGKWGQSFIPVGLGGPHVLVDGVLVGGEQR